MPSSWHLINHIWPSMRWGTRLIASWNWHQSKHLAVTLWRGVIYQTFLNPANMTAGLDITSANKWATRMSNLSSTEHELTQIILFNQKITLYCSDKQNGWRNSTHNHIESCCEKWHIICLKVLISNQSYVIYFCIIEVQYMEHFWIEEFWKFYCLWNSM